MSGLDPAGYERLTRFTERLLAPVADNANEGIARALLASRVRWQPLDLAFLRLMAARSAGAADYSRLMAMVERVREWSA